MNIFTVSAWFFTIVPRYDPFLSLHSTPRFQAHHDLVTIIATLRWASCGPVPGPQDAQRRVAIIVTNHDLTLAALGKKRKKAVRGVTFKSGLANVDRELSLVKMATDMAYAHYLSFFLSNELEPRPAAASTRVPGVTVGINTYGLFALPSGHTAKKTYRC